MTAILTYTQPDSRERMRYTARVLLDSMGLEDLSITVRESRAGHSAGLELAGGTRVSAAELDEIFASLTLKREIATGRRDLLGRFDEEAIAWDTSRPWVDCRAREALGSAAAHGHLLPAKERKFRVIISHDVDRTTGLEVTSVFKSLLQAAHLRGARALPLGAALSTQALLKNIEWLLDVERSLGIGAYFFMMAGPYGLGRYATRTDIRWQCSQDIARVIRNAGMTVGLHGSFYAGDQNLYGWERERLEEVIGAPVNTHRKHYLRFDAQHIWDRLEKAGIAYDFTVGFRSRLGFRAGTAQAYRTFDLASGRETKVISVPLLYMDTLPLTAGSELLDELRAALIEVKQVQGCVSLLFHPELFLIDQRARRFFEDTLSLCQDLGADLAGNLPVLPAAADQSERGDEESKSHVPLPSPDAIRPEQQPRLSEVTNRLPAIELAPRGIPPRVAEVVREPGRLWTGSPPRIPWPEGKSFAFSVFDDTDLETLENAVPVYRFLDDCGLRTTKSVWVLRGDPNKGRFPGQTCEDPEYLEWLLDLQARGFEIGWHGTTWYGLPRAEVIRSLDYFAKVFGRNPACGANHSSEEGIYWGDCRVGGLNRMLYNLMTLGTNRHKYRGHVEGDPFFWGDACQERITYFRNFVYRDINTLRSCPFMPYHDRQRPYVNYWFASSDGNRLPRFLRCLSEQNQDRLEEEGGVCIMYTHFACGFSEGRQIEPNFRRLIERLAAKNGWFVPVGKLLDYLREVRGHHVITDSQRRQLERKWLIEKMFIGST